MKKSYLLIVLAIIIVILINVRTSGYSIEDIDTIRIYSINQELIETFNLQNHPSEVNSIYTMIHSTKIEKLSHKALPSHTIQVETKNKIKKYNVYINFEDSTMYIRGTGKKAKRIISSSALEYLLLEGIQSVYPHYHPPRLRIAEGNSHNIVAPIVDYQWNYVRIDNNFYSKPRKHLSHEEIVMLSLSPSDDISFDFCLHPDEIIVEVFKNKEFVKVLDVEGNAFTPLQKKGPYEYLITAHYEESINKGYYGKVQHNFYITVDLPPKVSIQSTSVKLGGMFVIRVENLHDESKLIIQQNIVENIQAIDYKGDQLIIIPLDYWVKSGEYPLKIYLETDGRMEVIHEDLLIVEDRDFAKQFLTVNPQVAASTRNEAAYIEYAKYFTPARYHSHPVKLWEGSFITPLEGRITTSYGVMRYVNGALTSYRHNGIDIAAAKGTPIKASNTGMVVLSMNLILTGETIIIDHGLGIFTVYLHMDRRDVFEGDIVTKGEIIGTVGSTGFSTGPHLHWTASYYTKNLDPFMLVEWEGIE